MEDDRELFWKTVEPEYFRAMMFCRKLMNDRERGDDLFQDALVIAITKFHTLQERSAFRPWFYRTVVNTFSSRMRRRWWKRFVPLTSEMEPYLAGENPVGTYTARRWLKRAFRALSAKEQALVTLHELEGWPINELAGLYGKTEGAVKARLFRARRKMKNALIALSERASGEDCPGSELEENDQCAVVKPETD